MEDIKLDQIQLDPVFCHHLVALEVIYKINEREKRHAMNALILSPDGKINRNDIAKAQFNAQVRFRQEVNQKAEITDVFIMNIIQLGYMTQKEFHGDLGEAQSAVGEQHSGGEVNSSQSEDAVSKTSSRTTTIVEGDNAGDGASGD